MKTYTNPNQILRAKQAWNYLGISKAKFYRLIQEKKIKKGFPIAGRAVGWRLSDIDEYINSCEEIGRD